MQRWLMIVLGASLIGNGVLAVKWLDAPRVTNESFYHALAGNLQKAEQGTATSEQGVSLALANGKASYAEGL